MKRQGRLYYYDMFIIKKVDLLKYWADGYSIKEACCKYLCDKNLWLGVKPNHIELKAFNDSYHCYIICS